jgi:O-antigen polymerase
LILLYWVDQRTARYKQVNFGGVSRFTLRLSSLLLPILVCFYMVTALQTNQVLTAFERSNKKNPDLLDKAMNPFAWQDRYEWNIHSTFLKLGIATGKQQHIQTYVDWSVVFIKDKPRPALYENLIIAYEGLDQMRMAEAIRQEASYLFPILILIGFL